MEDYNRYLLALRHQEFLWEKRDYLVSRVRGICGLLEMDDAGIQELLRTLSPDSSRHAKIITWLKMKTKHTWP